MASRRVRTRADLEKLTPTEQLHRIRAASVASAMRGDPKLSLPRAARAEGLSAAQVLAFAPEAFERHGRSWSVTPSDRMPFVMYISSTEGVVERVVRGSRARSLVGRHHNAVERYLATGDTSALDPFVGKRVAGVELETAPTRLEDQFIAGELEFLELYTQMEGNS